MKKTIICVAVLMVSLFIFPLDSDAGGRGGARATRTTTIVKKEVVFYVSPQQFRKVDKIFSKKYGGHKCDGWEYDFDSQQYTNYCTKEKTTIAIKLLMDGSIMIKKWEDNYYLNTTIENKIGIWDRDK